MSQGTDTNLVFRALIMSGLVAFGFFLAARYGLITLALDSDKSYISYLILVVYGLATLHWLWLAYQLGNERKVFASLDGLPPRQTETAAGSPAGLLGRFLSNLARKRRSAETADASVLVNAFGDELLNRHALGHFISDVLLKLGLLGTVVGFIFMLLPIGDIDEFDPSIMRDLLAAMSSGMAVALYTTLAGLVTSTLLKLQYHLLDASAADLTTRLAVLVDVRGSHESADDAA